MSLEHSPNRQRLRDSFAVFDDDRMYSATQIAERIGCHVISIYRWAASGKLPKQIKIGHASRWVGFELNRALREMRADT